jgi:hypothetical protein
VPFSPRRFADHKYRRDTSTIVFSLNRFVNAGSKVKSGISVFTVSPANPSPNCDRVRRSTNDDKGFDKHNTKINFEAGYDNTAKYVLGRSTRDRSPKTNPKWTSIDCLPSYLTDRESELWKSRGRIFLREVIFTIGR